MRHRVAGRHLSRTSEHRLAMRRNIVLSLIEHETVSTTMAKAKDARALAEKLITLAKKGNLAARRRAISLLGNRDILVEEGGETVNKGTVIGKLFSELGPRYLDRPGGYTRIIRLPLRRLGDNGRLVLLQLVSEGKGQKKTRGKAAKEEAGAETEEKKGDAEQQVEQADKPE